MSQPPPYSPPGGQPPPPVMVSKVELTVSCNGLKDADVFSKSDPLCVVYSDINGRLQEVTTKNILKFFYSLLLRDINK